MILLVTSKDDLTTDYLILRLASREIPFFRFNTEDVLSQYQVWKAAAWRSGRTSAVS